MAYSKHTCKSGRTYLLEGDLASPCFNGASFGQVVFGTIQDLEDFDSKLKWNNMFGQYN